MLGYRSAHNQHTHTRTLLSRGFAVTRSRVHSKHGNYFDPEEKEGETLAAVGGVMAGSTQQKALMNEPGDG